ncbi:pyridoxal phosphate-dependent aminotransferase [Bacteroidetes bacterium endosymbiont of Geopemphigus sp.]|uniref:pyridoxal phosphate-dependent aminotransferase n=1 Tax=Bacteroidetes bacterium endosymbiont of Geopemphigus sp. TaxID=2047937 RepID=UPI0018A827CC|nr:pyridoxal phosphate-dependent aminotransferase [Bacteroidetes bacterium endosymbiont of Geopemphigus sp.]
MQRISRRLQNMSYSQTLAMSAKARELSSQGHDVISLSVGEPDFSPPNFVLQAAKKAIDKGHHYYTPVPGYLELREAVCEKFLRDNQLNYQPSQVVVSTGGKQSIINVFLALLNPGDEVIIPGPYWVSYYEMANLCEAKQVILPTSVEANFKISPEQLETAITPRSKVFIFSSPCNPSGSVYTREELKALAEVFARHPQLIIISDEIYEHINYSGSYTSIAEFPEVYEQIVTLNGLSKAFAMTGWRVGYIGAPEWLAKACDKVQGQTTSGANAIAQQAAISALRVAPERIGYMIEAFEKRRDLVLKEIQKLPGFYCNIPQGTFYIFPEVSALFGRTFSGVKISNSDDLSMYLLEKAHVAVVGGAPFGDEKSLRISYAVSEEKLNEAFSRIHQALS